MRRIKLEQTLNASDIGVAEFCPYQLYLRQLGCDPDKALHRQLKAGENAHKKYNRSRERTPSFAIIMSVIGIVLLLLWLESTIK